MNSQRFLDFTDGDIGEEDRKIFKPRLQGLADKENIPPLYFDWGLHYDLKIAPKLVTLLRRTINTNAGILHTQPWFNIFSMQEPVYRELNLEFFSTVKVREVRYHPKEPILLESHRAPARRHHAASKYETSGTAHREPAPCRKQG